MFIEQCNVKQNPGEPFRRIFFCDENMLYVWYNDSRDRILGIQLDIDDIRQHHVITAFQGRPVAYTTSDEGKFYRSNILKHNGKYDPGTLHARITALIHTVPEEIKREIHDILQALENKNYVRYPIEM